MKGDVFSSWLKELCSLIFVQTFQAFLLAIVMSIIIAALAKSETGTIDACGLLAVFALSSFPKIELLLKNIFGLTSQYGDPSLARGQQSFIGGMTALWGTKRLLDNPRKVMVGGVKTLHGGIKTAKAKRALRKANEPEEGGNAIGAPGPQGPGTGIGAGKNAASNNAALTAAINNLTNAVQNNTASAKENNMDKLKKALDDARKERNEGFRSMVSGTAETIGALHGAVAGGVVGLSQGGDISKITSSALKGAGGGDLIGEGASKIAIDGIPELARTTKDAATLTRDAITDALKSLQNNNKSNTDNKIDNIGKKIDMYQKSQPKNTKNSSVDDV